ncbi:hypothetical protein [Bacteroidetes bacterium endosymbiont of Geopemphigus sp.]|uniref:hypothetical protein n=1 Tax=Bacteroidetes bacterium endosymbiont of Geopemphigus sp. TaxID=2047937 RepID=UPI000CD2CE42|nr:hypothetical protein [Bacteroidetes bacterium endosymbiont of Geopemphigus sp.]
MPYFQKHYEKISTKDEKVSLKYKSTLSSRNLYESLQEDLQKDLTLEYTSVGIHKYDLELLIEDSSIKCGSQGQQKSFLICLKLVQFDFIKKQLNTSRILLLDNIFDKLDEIRINHLVTFVNEEYFG